MSSLRSQLDSLAQAFATGVLAAIRTASIEDLLAESSGGTSGRGRGRARAKAAGAGTSAPKAKKTKGGRLARRSAEDVAKVLHAVVKIVRTSKAGLRSEEIRKQLGLDRREVPRILKQGLSTRKLKSKGQKRATIYSAA